MIGPLVVGPALLAPAASEVEAWIGVAHWIAVVFVVAPVCESATEGAMLAARDFFPFFVPPFLPPPPRDGVDGVGVDAWNVLVCRGGELIVVQVEGYWRHVLTSTQLFWFGNTISSRVENISKIHISIQSIA